MSDGLKKDLAELHEINVAMDKAQTLGDKATEDRLRKRLGPLLERIKSARKDEE